MQHVKPSAKGDPLCPLGFHPQVRWPTRCKRCFRDYKDHSNRNKDNGKSSLRKDDTTLSTPSLNNEANESINLKNMSSDMITSNSKNYFKIDKGCGPSRKTTSWTSTPDLTTLSDSITPQVEKIEDDEQAIPEYTVRRRSNLSRKDSVDVHSPRNSYNGDIAQYTPVHMKSMPNDENMYNDDEDTISLADSDTTTDTYATIINEEDLHDQVMHLKAELKLTKEKCEKAEREKSDILLRRLASLDTTPTSRTTATELLKHQQKINDLKSTCESLSDEKRILTQRVHELEIEFNKNKNSKVKSDDVQLVRSKLIAAETKIEDLTEENNDLNKEIHNMEQEMRDNFREEQDNEFIMLKREFDQVSKNCRILAFKLKKAERRMEELDNEKIENDKKTKELIERLQGDLEKSKSNVLQGDQKKRPMLGMIPKSASGERVSRESLTRGDSQEDPVQLQRDLQDSIEREADMREQLRFSEEEAKMLRNKVSRLEEDNESMVLQLKKMATKTSYRPTNITDRDEGISDVEDATELKLLLELSEQEITVLKRKIEEFEVEKDQLKAKVLEYQTKLASKKIYKPISKQAQTKTKEVKADFDKQTKAIKQLEVKTMDLENQLKSERQQIENLKSTHKKEIINKEECIKKLQEQSTFEENKKIMDIQNEFEKKIKKIENEMMIERKNYKDILNKYDILQKEQIDTKSKMAAEKEKLQCLLESRKKDTLKVEVELKALKDKYNISNDLWNKEKLEMQKKVKDLEIAHSNDSWIKEKENMKKNLEEYLKDIKSLNKQCSQYTEQIEKLKKDNESLQRNLDDFEKVVKIQHSRSMETELLEKNLKDMKIKLYNEEQARKTEVAALKVRYDNRMSVLSEELKNSQFQTLRFKRERDSYKQILDSADSNHQKGNYKIQNNDNQKEEYHILQQQVSCMEEQLSEARLECSRLKTELVSEKSAWEITKSEMTSSINKLEEERLLNSGRSKLTGLKARMELAWQKEREEQQRLLQETSTLARDLRQTLYEVERERDKDRLESKRRIDQLTKNMEVDQQENRKKTNEMQCDLMDLRDAHAKLRTINEKLRKEKDKIEQECESLRLCNVRLRTDPQVEVKINNLSQLIKSLTIMINENYELTNKSINSINAPTPPARRKSSTSREASPDLNSNQVLNNNNNEQIKQLLNKVNEVTKELVINTNQPDIRSKRAVFGVRSSSTENDFNDKPPIRGSLYRKSLSLEQNFGNTDQDIWKRDERSQSRNRLTKQPNSFDSQQSNSSSKSDIVSGEKTKKKGLFGKLKKLTKSSKSFDNDSDLSFKSSSSIYNIDVSSSKDSRGKLNDIFKPSTLPNLKKRAMSPSIFRRSESSRTSPSPSVRSDEYEEIS
ncbi:golgin subfamily A member 6-like protein 22 isoform X1 [Rhopalosiphum padi]|uniref:golgin subfamily A member 6-like protein 22 isoform X1 n=2 Tax=Rhopalosiphum padi TaxID=40932 RepID=UPI00298E565E|nr:golgin subfamily A member 6-like protein 22 isoform X1 [Rhopalosiphum padi]